MTKTYNGFPPEYRDKQGGRVYAAFRKGTLTRPTACIVCNLDTTVGATVHAHNEDYHQPLNYVGVCYCCHMAIHRRYQEPDTWVTYLDSIAAGWQPPRTSNYRDFINAFRSTRHHANMEPTITLNTWVTDLPLIEPDLYTLPTLLDL